MQRVAKALAKCTVIATAMAVRRWAWPRISRGSLLSSTPAFAKASTESFARTCLTCSAVMSSRMHWWPRTHAPFNASPRATRQSPAVDGW